MKSFALWLETSNTAIYNKYWAPVVEKLRSQRKDRFASWFPPGKDRVYIPIRVPRESFSREAISHSDQVRKETEEALKKHGYQIINWGKGICISPTKSKMPILSALDALGEIDTKNHYFHSWLNNNYSGVSINPKQNDFLIIISKDVHDLARMSTARPWGSCISLPNKFYERPEGLRVKSYAKTEKDDPQTGGKKLAWQYLPPQEDPTYKKLEEEILEGGLVAYLTTPNDTELNSPLARIHLPRYEDAISGRSFILCKNDSSLIYGKRNLEFFISFVQKWVNEKQSSQPSGYFSRKASNWAEGTPWDVFDLSEIDEEYLKKAINHYLSLGNSSGQYAAAKYVHALMSKLLKEWTISDDFWKYLKGIVFSDKLVDNPVHALRELYKKYPGKITYEDIIGLSKPEDIFGRSSWGGSTDEERTYREWMLKKYEELLDAPINDENAKWLMKIAKQMKYWIAEDDKKLKKLFDWGERLSKSGSEESITNYILLLLGFRYSYTEKIHKALNSILEKHRRLVPKEEEYSVQFYISDLDKMGLEKPDLKE